MITARTTWVLLALLVFTGGMLAYAPQVSASYWCGGAEYGNPDECWQDSDCNPGVCSNRQCQCGSDIEGTPICGDRCPDRGLCYDGADTVHIEDCRGIQSGDSGGVIGYCFTCACSPNEGDPCQSASNSCGMRNDGTIQCDGSCSASPPPDSLCGNPPTGNFDAVDCSSARGWSSDPDYSGAVNVQIYRDGPAGTGTLMAVVPANQNYPGRGNVGWDWAIPSSMKNGAAHTLYVYGINVNAGGTPQGPNPLLSGSPKSITCTEPPTGTLTSATCGTGAGTASDPQGSPIQVTLWDGPVGTGVQLANGTANPAFSLGFAPFTDGQTHSINAAAQDIPTGTSYQLTGTQSVTCAPAVTLTADPATVAFGSAATLTWSVTNAVSCNASPGGWFNPASVVNGVGTGSGSSGPLVTTTTFVLTCLNAAGQSATDSKTVSVNAPPPIGTITNCTDTDYCTVGAGMNIDWQYESPARPIGAYQVQVLEPGGTVVFDTGKTSYTAMESESEKDGPTLTKGRGVPTWGSWLVAAVSSLFR
jgi:hypothetical protein